MYTTPVSIPKYSFTIDHSTPGLVLGSCFAQEIGTKLVAAKFPGTLNPHGILFNPASIGKTYSDIVTSRIYTEKDLVNHNGLWHSMHHHGSFSAAEQKTVLEKINTPTTSEFDYIIITLGTAWVYQYDGETVANCHKLPADRFARRRLSVDECVEKLLPIAQSTKPVIITLSPVRHIKDGLSENALSKAILRVAAAELCDRFANVHYFPSYEIVVDELRDYRYYGDDMIHPSKVAVDYIWQRFSQAFFSPYTRLLVADVAKICSSLNHRPLHPESPEYQKFRRATFESIKRISQTHPTIDFSSELALF